MSFDFRGIRIQSNDPLTQFLVEQQKKLAKFLTSQQVAAVDSDNEDIYADAQDMETAVKYHSELSGQHLFQFNTEAYPPDLSDITVWIRGTNLGNNIRDISYFHNDADLEGDPVLVDGTMDLGLNTHGTKSTAIRLNRPTSGFENNEWIQIPDAVNIQFASDGTGFSMFFRFRMHSIEDQGGRSPTLFNKIDDSVPNNGIMVQVKSDGRLLVIVKKGGTVTAKQTAVDIIETETIYEVHITFAVSGALLKIYINGTNMTVSDYLGLVNWHTILTTHDVFMGRRGHGELNGCAYYDFYDMIGWKTRVLNQTEVTHFITNKWTIADIGFGKCIIGNHFAMLGGGIEPPQPPAACSFSEDSFSDVSFTICVTGGGGTPTTGSFTTTSFTDTSFIT